MKILIIAPLNSFHTQRWLRSLSKEGITLHVFDYREVNKNDFKDINNVECLSFDSNSKITNSTLRFVYSFYLLKKLIKRVKPDIIHSHYASSYGLLGALVNYKTFILSFWGSDIFEFPKKSLLHKLIIKFNIYKATKILSTSNTMALEIKKYTSKNVTITPFGVDTSKFKKKNKITNNITIGSIKQLEEVYGHKYLLEAFAILTKKYPNIDLLIVGSGSIKDNLEQKIKELKIEKYTNLTGKIHFDDIPKYHNLIDIYVNFSLEESFGVSVIEASSCEVPVIVSNVGGLPEVVDDKITGLVIETKNVKSLVSAIEYLILNERKRLNMGKEGRKKVIRLYNWSENVNLMIKIYEGLL